MQTLERWPKETFLHLHSFAIAVLLITTSFYAIALFHLKEFVFWLHTINDRYELQVYNTIFILAMFLIGATTKFGTLWLLGPKPTRWQVVKKSFLTISFYLGLIGFGALACMFLSLRIPILLKSAYWSHAHWFWLGLLLFLAFGFLALMLSKYELYTWDVLRELRTIPIVTPIFCFAGPKFFLDNIRNFGVAPTELRPHSVLLIVSGVLFLLCLVLIALSPKLNESGADEKPKIIGFDGKLGTQAGGIHAFSALARIAAFGLLGLALYLFALALLDATLLMSIATGTS